MGGSNGACHGPPQGKVWGGGMRGEGRCVHVGWGGGDMGHMMGLGGDSHSMGGLHGRPQGEAAVEVRGQANGVVY